MESSFTVMDYIRAGAAIGGFLLMVIGFLLWLAFRNDLDPTLKKVGGIGGKALFAGALLFVAALLPALLSP